MKKFDSIHWHLEDGDDALELWAHTKNIPYFAEELKYAYVACAIRQKILDTDHEITLDEARKLVSAQSEEPANNPVHIQVDDDDDAVDFTLKDYTLSQRRRIRTRKNRRLAMIEPHTMSIRITDNGGVVRCGSSGTWRPVWKKIDKRLRRHDGINACRNYNTAPVTNDDVDDFDIPDYTAECGGYWDNNAQRFVSTEVPAFNKWFANSTYFDDYDSAKRWGDIAEANAWLTAARKEYAYEYNLPEPNYVGEVACVVEQRDNEVGGLEPDNNYDGLFFVDIVTPTEHKTVNVFGYDNAINYAQARSGAISVNVYNTGMYDDGVVYRNEMVFHM